MKTQLLIITALESELKQSDLPADVKLIYTGVGKINAALASYKAIAEHQPKLIVNFGTVGDNFVTSQDPWLGLQKVDVVDMELFAIAATAFQFNIPWRSYKYITDEANSSAGNEWQGNMHQGHDLYMQKLHELL